MLGPKKFPLLLTDNFVFQFFWISSQNFFFLFLVIIGIRAQQWRGLFSFKKCFVFFFIVQSGILLFGPLLTLLKNRKSQNIKNLARSCCNLCMKCCLIVNLTFPKKFWGFWIDMTELCKVWFFGIPWMGKADEILRKLWYKGHRQRCISPSECMPWQSGPASKEGLEALRAVWKSRPFYRERGGSGQPQDHPQ